MADNLSPEERSENMRRIRSKNTRPEILVRRTLHRLGFRFRLHSTALLGKPDIVLPRYKTAVFVHGCFWHVHEGCRLAAVPSTRAEFWKAKLEGNLVRDEAAIAKLAMLGWRVLIVWECSTRRGTASDLFGDLLAWIESPSEYGEIGASPRHP